MVTEMPLVVLLEKALEGDAPYTGVGVLLPDPLVDGSKTGDVVLKIAGYPTTIKDVVWNVI